MALADVVHSGSPRERAAADAWIQRNSTVPARLSWRAAELTSADERRLLATSLRGMLADLSPSRLPGAAPLNSVALRPHAQLLLKLAERLDDLGRPVAARGILEVEWLLVDPNSPLHAEEDAADDVRKGVVATLDLLEVRL
jgi:hypothetical protein